MKNKSKKVSIKIIAIIAIALLAIGSIFAYFRSSDFVVNKFRVGRKYTITGEVIGGHGTMEGVPQSVFPGADSNDVFVNVDAGYKIGTITVFDMNNGVKVEPGTEFEASKRGEKYLIRTIRNVNCDKHIEVTLVEITEVAMIVAVPEDDADLAELASLVDSQPVLNHTYSTLEDAIKDAEMINEERDRNGLEGKVEIKILKDIDEVEENTILEGNDVILDLNGKTITGEYNNTAVLTVQGGGSLQVLDRTYVYDYQLADDAIGTIKNTEGTAIKIEEGGELTLGTNNTNISRKTPTIEGDQYGIVKANTQDTIFNFYDGRVIAEEATLSGSDTVDDTPKGYKFSVDDSGAKKVATLQINNGIEAMIGKTTYITLEDAFNYVIANSELGIDDEIEIDVVNTVDIDTTQITLPANKNVVLDLNGHTINANNTKGTFINRGKMRIIDSTLNNEESEYLELVQSPDASYGFNKVGTYYQSNNAGVANSTADSYIEIDLRNADEATHTLKINANVSGQKVNDYGYAIVTESPNTPTDLTGNIFKQAFVSNPKYYTKELTENKLYYLHVGYVKDATNDLYLDSLFLNEVTLDGQELLEGIGFGTGMITAPISNLATGTLIIEGGRINRLSANAFAYSTINNTGYVELRNGNIDYAIRNLEDVATTKATGGYAMRIDNADKGTIEIEDGARVCEVEAVGYYSFKSDYSNYNSVNDNARQGGGTITINGGILGGHRWYDSTDDITTGILNSGNVENFTVNKAIVVGNVTLKEDVYNNTTFAGTTENPIIVYGSISCNTNGNKEFTIKNTKVNGNLECPYSNSARPNGLTVLNLENCDVGGLTSMSGGSYQYSTYKDAILNIKSGNYGQIKIGNYTDLNIGIKNDANNTEISTTNPRIYSVESSYYYSPINSTSTTDAHNNPTEIYFYDGIIIGEKNNIDDLVITGFEETDSEGYPTRIVIEQYEDNENISQMTIQRAQERTARINKSYASKLDLSNVKYTSDDTYYYFYTLPDAIGSCNTSDNVVIELLENINTLYFEIESGKNITIDLNGKTIKMLSSFSIQENANVLLKSSVDGGFIDCAPKTASGKFKAIDNYGTLNIEDVNIAWDKAGDTAANLRNYNVLNVNSGKIAYVLNHGTATITGGEVAWYEHKQNTASENAPTTTITGGKIRVIGSTGTLNVNSGTSTTKNSVQLGCTLASAEINVDNVEISNYSINYNSGSSGTYSFAPSDSKLTINNSICNNTVYTSDTTGQNLTFTNSTFKDNVTVITNGNCTFTENTVGSSQSEKALTLTHSRAANSDKCIRIENSNIYGYIESKSATAPYIIIGNGTNVISTSGSVLRGSGAVQLGEKDGNVSETAPYLEGKDTTIANTATKYYDGKLVTNHTQSANYYESGLTEEQKQAKEQELLQEAKDNTYPVGKTVTIAEFEDGYGLYTTDESSYTTSGANPITVKSTVKKTTVIRLSPIARVLKTQATVQGLSANDYTENGDYYEFYKIQTALDSCKDNTDAEVILLKDFAIIDSTKVLTVGANKKISFDFAGNVITSSVINAITNNGTLELKNSNPPSSSTARDLTLKSYSAGESIGNYGTLKISNISIMYGRINNYGTMEVDTLGKALYNTYIYNMEGNTANINFVSGSVNFVYNTSSNNNAVTLSGGTIEQLLTFTGKTSITGGKITKVYNGYRYEYNGTTYDYINKMIATNEFGRGFNIDNVNGSSSQSSTIIDRHDIMVEESEMTITGNPTITTKIFNDSKMTINVTSTIGAEINNRTGAVLTLNGGTFSSLIANVQFKTASSSTQQTFTSVLAESSTGILNINNVTINNQIDNNGVLNLGVNGDSVNSTPTINNQIVNYGENIFNYYDGVIIATTPVVGGITAIADNTMIKSEAVDSKLKYSLIPIAGDNYKVETNGTTIYKPTLQEAFDACLANNTGTPDKVTAMIDTFFTTADCATVDAGQKIIFDINGKTMHGLSTGTMIKNEGELEITDSTKTADTYGEGQFIGRAKYIIESTGNKLRLSGGQYKTTNLIEKRGSYGMYAEGNVEFDGAYIELTKNDGMQIENAQNVTFTSGKINIPTTNVAQYKGVNIMGSYDNHATVKCYEDFKVVGSKQYQYGIWAEYSDLTVYGDGFADFNPTDDPYSYPIAVVNGKLIVEENVSFRGILDYRGTTEITIKPGASVGKIINAAHEGATDPYPYFADLTITDATVGTIACSIHEATITNSNITDLTLRGKLEGGTYTTRGYATITGGTIGKFTTYSLTTCTLENINITTGGISVGQSSRVSVISGTIKNTDGVGANVSGTGVLYLGTQETGAQEVDITNPSIEGSTYGLQGGSSTNIWFYDGVIKGGTKALNGVINGYGSYLYTTVYEDADQKIAHPGIIATVDNKAKIGSVEYATIQAALDAVASLPNNTATIEMLKSVELTQTVVIPANYNVTLNLKGQIITGSCVLFEVSSGATLTIIDSNGTNGGIMNSVGEAINNKGTFSLGTSGNTVQNAGPKIKGETYAIVNTGTINMYTGVLKAINTDVISGTPSGVNAITGKPSGYNAVTNTQVTSGKTYNIIYLEQE